MTPYEQGIRDACRALQAHDLSWTTRPVDGVKFTPDAHYTAHLVPKDDERILPGSAAYRAREREVWEELVVKMLLKDKA